MEITGISEDHRGQLGTVGSVGGKGSAEHLDLGDVEEAGGAADECATGEGELGQRLQAALVEAARAVLQHGAPLQQPPDFGVALPPLELLVGAQVGVPVVQRHHQPAQTHSSITAFASHLPGIRFTQAIMSPCPTELCTI